MHINSKDICSEFGKFSRAWPDFETIILKNTENTGSVLDVHSTCTSYILQNLTNICFTPWKKMDQRWTFILQANNF